MIALLGEKPDTVVCFREPPFFAEVNKRNPRLVDTHVAVPLKGRLKSEAILNYALRMLNETG